ncbi:MAG: hypothetical protein NC429_10910 [Lachnospiraceae bacterium]|nr:hypothetical protein [Lachnospiraceae bacterium]
MEQHEEGNKIDLMKYRLETAEELIEPVENFCKSRIDKVEQHSKRR